MFFYSFWICFFTASIYSIFIKYSFTIESCDYIHWGFPFSESWNIKSFYVLDRKSTRLNSSHANISYAVFCLKKKIANNGSWCCIRLCATEVNEKRLKEETDNKKILK